MRTWRIVSRNWTVLIALVIAATAAMLGVFVAPGHSVTPQVPPVAALTTGNAVAPASLPADVQRFINLVAPTAGVDAATLSQRVFHLRSSMGPRALDLYAFADNSGRPCFVVPTEGGTCAFGSQTDAPALLWQIGGGNGGNDPSYLFGLAEDTVQSVTLTVDGNDVPVSMNNSVAYAAFPNTAKTATVTVTSTDGSKHTDSVGLQPAGTKP
jgi:hypothetical protein